MQFVFKRATRVTGQGNVILFEAGVPRDVLDQEMWPFIMALGGTPLTDAPVDFGDDTAAPARPEDKEFLDKAIREAIEQLMEENDATKFGASGQPRVTAVSKILGYRITREEIEDVWFAMRSGAR